MPLAVGPHAATDPAHQFVVSAPNLQGDLEQLPELGHKSNATGVTTA